MPNEVILLLSVLVLFSLTVLAAKFFGEHGLVAWMVMATVLANIEVLILVRAFGLEQTLGNVLFASISLSTDILSELYGKKASTRAVYISVLTSAVFMLISQSWLLYTPSGADWASPAIREIFSNTPRLIFVSLAVYAISQRLDVWLYYKWWAFTEKRFGDKRRGLWIRNKGSTLISQLVNSALFNFGAFWGVFDTRTLVSITVSTYLIYVVGTALDTPFMYLARRICKPKVGAE